MSDTAYAPAARSTDVDQTMSLAEAIHGRRAIRAYRDAPLTRTAISDVIADAVQAPSSMNRQPWSFTVVLGRERLRAISDEAKAVALAEMPEAQRKALSHALAPETFDIFYDAPALVVISATASDPMASQDCCLAAATLMLAAHGRGLGTCWIGFAEPWLATPEGKARLGIPPEHTPVAPIILGWPAQTPGPDRSSACGHPLDRRRARVTARVRKPPRPPSPCPAS